MTHLLNLLAAIALLVWGTHLVRAGVLQVFGANLRALLGRSTGNRFTAALSGLGVTALVQSSTATSLMTASFVGQGLIALPAALAVMLGADVGTALMSVLFSLDLSWLSPLFLLVGIVLFLARHGSGHRLLPHVQPHPPSPAANPPGRSEGGRDDDEHTYPYHQPLWRGALR